MTSETEHEEGRADGRMGRRRFFVLGGAGAAVLLGGAGAARALITAGGSDATLKSLDPVGLNPTLGRATDAVGLPSGGVWQYALAGTDGWVTFPLGDPNHAAGLDEAHGAKPIDPYFPDPLADPANSTTYAFCFRNVTGLDRTQVMAQKGHTQVCAPLFYTAANRELWITLTNLGLKLRPDLVDGHTLHWHGFRNAIPFYDGVPESSIAVAIDHDFTYVYRPKDAGTYMYHCHFEDVEHVTMGMHGIVFVLPDWGDLGATKDGTAFTLDRTKGQGKAYGLADGDAAGETWYDRQYAIMLSEVDTRAHFNDAHIQATDWTDFHADMWTMNGRAFPDTLEPNGTRTVTGDLQPQRVLADGYSVEPIPLELDNGDPNPAARLHSNPLSSLVQCAPGERVLIRFANLGFLNHTIVFPGLEVDVLGRDARYVPASAQRKATDSIQIGPGESRDVFFTAPDEPGDYWFYDRGMSHYTGSADGTNAWVGGQRSAIRVMAEIANVPQLKPNGWAGEAVYDWEFPRQLTHTGPVVTAAGQRRVIRTQVPNDAPYLVGTVAPADSSAGVTVTDLWWASDPKPTSLTSSRWRRVNGSPDTFAVRVGNAGAVAATYWMVARDSTGTYGTPVSVHI